MGEDRHGWLFDTLASATAELRAFLEGRDPDGPLDAAAVRQLERLTERYQRADEAVDKHVEAILKRSTKRARR
jgi:hypothetical protein